MVHEVIAGPLGGTDAEEMMKPSLLKRLEVCSRS